MQRGVASVALAWQMGYPVEADESREGAEDDLALTRAFPPSYVALVLEAFDRRAISNGKAAELLALNRGAFDHFSRYWRQQAEARPPRVEEVDPSCPISSPQEIPRPLAAPQSRSPQGSTKPPTARPPGATPWDVSARAHSRGRAQPANDQTPGVFPRRSAPETRPAPRGA
jgi:hypothetical protein